MGFCIFNNVAIAARYIQKKYGLTNILIVDWDVHHGNGTHAEFYDDPNVLYFSVHQYPFYPGSGALQEQGHAAGEGSTVNLPLPAGCGDAEYGAAFQHIVAPVLREFRPQILLVSAGFDAHTRDPLASMQVSASGFRAFAATLRALADELCEGRLVLTLEGGYDLDGIGRSSAAVMGRLLGDPYEPAPRAEGEAVDRMVELFRRHHARHWPVLVD